VVVPLKNSRSAENQTFQKLMSELAAVVDRLMQDEKARRRVLAREIRNQLEAIDGELVELAEPTLKAQPKRAPADKRWERGRSQRNAS
jgi:hypothetical protein